MERSAAPIANAHNLRAPPPAVKPYGIRVSLPRDDTFCRLLGADWSRTHWYATAAERDAALEEMRREHEYSRAGDAPYLIFEKVENLAAKRAR